MGLPPFRYESFSFRRETAGFPRVFYIFWQRKQLLPRPTGPINWDLAGKARSKCVTNAGHKVQLPLGPSTSDTSANWDLSGRSPLLGEGGSRSETGVGRYNLPGSAPHPPQCAHWGTFPQGKASPQQIPICEARGMHPPAPGVSGGCSAVYQHYRYIVHIGAGGAGDDQAAYGL